MDCKIPLSGKTVSMRRHGFRTNLAAQRLSAKFENSPTTPHSLLVTLTLHVFSPSVFSLYTFSHSFRLLPLVLKFKLSFNIFGFINGEFNYQTPPCILPGTTLTLEITVTYPPAGANVNLFGLGGGVE